MPDQFDHLPLARQQPVNARRTMARGLGVKPPPDVPAHARKLLAAVQQGAERAATLEPGFDPRLLLKLDVEGLDPSELAAIPGLEVVSQEEKTVVAVFTSPGARTEFQRRLNTLAEGGLPTRKDIFFAIKGVDTWTRENRLGRSLRTEGIPASAEFVVDVELWPLDRRDERVAMLAAFKSWCDAHAVEVLDQVNHPNAVLVRIRLTQAALERALLHRDVRRIELPPRMRVPFELHRIPLNDYPPVPPPPDDAPGVVVLDSGIIAGHPFLGPAVGEATSYLDGQGPEDANGHGTMVAGLALYGDVAASAAQRTFVPELRLFSGRLTDETNESAAKLLENLIPKAVAYFSDTYGCRVFNISLGDSRRPYLGGHLGPLAAILDTLARERNILFVVSAGNYLGSDDGPGHWRDEYPRYLLEREDARIIDPAPALNALTVGSLARYDLSRFGARYVNDPAHQPIARPGQPSPFSRMGPSVRDAIKPEVVDFGGNWYVNTRAGGIPMGRHELGETSTAYNFAAENLLTADSGTSFAAPRVANLAARLLKRYPGASSNLLRALIVVHARVPEATAELLGGEKDKVLRAVGYGQPDLASALASTEQQVTLMSEERLGENAHHFYEVPIPEDFLAGPTRRHRQIRVALAHMPYVRSTRVDYRGSDFNFRLVRAQSLEEVSRIYKKTPEEEREDVKGEVGSLLPGLSARSRGTVQAGTWDIKMTTRRWSEERLFIVVTRQTKKWALGQVEQEPYALVAVLDDRTNEEARLYTQLRAKLQTRVRPRARL